jgi:hypothetical protein
MGCASGREVCKEEHLIVQSEQMLKLNYVSVIDIDVAFRKYNRNGDILQSHLIQISNTLGFRYLNTPFNTKIQYFYSCIKNDSGSYPLKDLLLIAILLGKGKPSVKANLIYEIYDEYCTHQLDIDFVMTEIVERILKHSCITLLELVDPRSLHVEVNEKLQRYKKKLESVVGVATQEIRDHLVVRGNVISLDTFVEVFSNPIYSSSTSIRQHLISLRKKTHVQSLASDSLPTENLQI